MAKKVTFSKPQRTKEAIIDPEKWVATGETADDEAPANGGKKKAAVEEELTRFTIDIPTSLHARIKAQCALRRASMKDEIQSLLEKHYR